MGNHHDNISLDWVRGEIQDTLTQGQHALEAYVENRDDTARLRFCLNYLHQVHGTLQMVELYGAALLTEEMEKLTQAILNDQVASIDDAVDVLMQAILQLPRYLDHLSTSRDDFPLVLLPLLNDLRAARGESLLSDTSLFKPDLRRAHIKAGTAALRLQQPKVLGHLRKLRQMYQYALAGVIREENLDAHFDYLQKVILRLIRLCQKTPRGELWKAASALVETLQAGVNPVNMAVKSLLRQLDHEIRLLIEEHDTILQQPVPETLLKHLLYYVALARDLNAPYTRTLRADYRLDEALPSEHDIDNVRNQVSGPGRETIHSVVTALNEELSRLKDQLDLFVRAQFRQNSDLEELLPGMRQVANTLAVVGLGIPRKVMAEQIELVERLARQAGRADDGILMDIAGALLYIEASLAGLDADQRPDLYTRGEAQTTLAQPPRELTEANTALLRESRNTLEQVKSAIVNFIASQWNIREIEHVPELLHTIRGGLNLLPLEKVAAMLASAERYVRDVLLTGRQVPDWKQLDTLADAITSIEYYLELLADGVSHNDTVLQVAENSLASLGFPVGAEPTWQAPENAAGAQATAEESAAVLPEAAKASDEELLDDDILGIFVEEAGEVLETIREYYPRLKQNHDDREALTEVRRAFHTLKGSGRLVGAISIGELAWAAENLLNRVIDQNIRLSDDIFSLIDEVNVRIPSLIEEFRTGQAEGDVSALIRRAEALADTRRADTDDTASDTVPVTDSSQTAGTGPVAPTEEAAADAEPAGETVAVPETDSPVSGEAGDGTAGSDNEDEGADDDLIGAEILEIFVEEAQEVLETIHEYLPMLLRQHDDRSALTEVRRAFHTLKGSGRMVGASVVGELAWAVENMLNRVIDGSIFMNDDIATLLQDVTAVLPQLVGDFEQRRPASVDVAPMEARAYALASGEVPDAAIMPDDETPHPEGSSTETAAAGPATTVPDDLGTDPDLVEIFASEASIHLENLRAFLKSAEGKSQVPYTDELTRALHTLKGSANTAGIEPIAKVITPLERFVKEARAQNRRADAGVLELITQACDFLDRGLEQLHTTPQAPLPGTEDFLARLEQISQQLQEHPETAEEPDRERSGSRLVELFLGEDLDILLDAGDVLERWREDTGATDTIARIRSELERLSQCAAAAGQASLAQLAGALDRVYTQFLENQNSAVSEDLIATLRKAHDQLINLMDQVAAGLATHSDPELLARLETLALAPSPEDFALELDDSLEAIDLSLDSEGVEATEEPVAAAGLPEPEVEEAGAGPAMPETETPDAGGDTDPELLAVFLEEARDLIDSTAEALQNWSEDTGNADILRLLQRDLHTLKGGARLAGVGALGDLAHELETLFEGLAEQRLAVTGQLSDLLFRCHDRLAAMIEDLENGSLPPSAPDLVSDIHAYTAQATGQHRPVTEVPLPGTPQQPTAAAEETAFPETSSDRDSGEAFAPAETAPDSADMVPLPEVSETGDTDATAMEAPASEADEPAPSGETDTGDSRAPAAASTADDGAPSLPDPELVGIFLEEAYDLINATGSALHSWSENPGNTEVAATLQRDVHTLKGGARMAGIEAIADLSHVLEDLFEKVAQGQLAASEPMIDLLFACHDRLAGMVEQVASHRPCVPATDLIARVRSILHPEQAAPETDMPAPPLPEMQESVPTPSGAQEPEPQLSADDELIAIFLDEGREIQEAIDEYLTQWREDPEHWSGLTQLQQELHTLKGGARLADLDPVADLAEAWHKALDTALNSGQIPAQLLALGETASARLRTMFDTLATGQRPEPEQELVEAFAAAAEETPAAVPAAETESGAEPATDPETEADPEILGIFLEEAAEIMDQLEQLLADWHKDPGNSRFCQELQRALHTLKGGARLAQLRTLGDKAHAFENRLIELEGKAPDEAQWQAIDQDHDTLVKLLAEVQQPAPAPAAPADEKMPPVTQAEPAPVTEPAPKAGATPQAPAATAPAPAAGTKAPKPAAARKVAKESKRPQESVRVSAPLLEELVNLAGETSITRGRLEQQTSDFSHTLEEMAATIERLREQLRRMEIETEAQILFRAEQDLGPDYSDEFDPLEMDRYSSIQQLSRSLTESISDLADLRETLSERLRDTETLLVQQSRINTELQEGLMKTRMIPFASMVPRLRRIVRQISGELGKKVSFDVRNAEGEMDRNILERMIAPLEHMLRNALDHGIEAPAERVRAGKPETGQVQLSLSREGGDVVLRMSDDGRGIPADVIRDKAIRLGMMRADEELSNREILRFILQHGFSTAEKVTQISGRGVGMDVVSSEIKQLGGSLDIDSTYGQGTTFTIRLPFTVSVNRALMVTTGEDFYAIPLNTIEGIVRVSTYELEEYYKPDAPLYEYAGQKYRLQYLGSLLNSSNRPKLQGQALPLPVILVRGAEQPMALQVDSLMGSREIVVKSLGPQFKSVRGVSGATILGDGNVVVILDLPTMIRSDILAERQRQTDLEKAREAELQPEQATRVMVVDDSVTVRKVTSRLLERNGMEVFTAKDGLDAVAQLQDHKPDIILLDIEMPRMDGFEVASFVRHNDRLRDTPICMITSRTGEKHRDRALSIGVNEYLGKPFQEAELLDTIKRLTGGG